MHPTSSAASLRPVLPAPLLPKSCPTVSLLASLRSLHHASSPLLLLPQELVDQLLELSERTAGGINASPARRDEIAEVVEELEAFCPKAPLRSPLLYGDYEVLYTSKPLAAGGPYRSLPGRIVFPGQRPLQSIVAPNTVVREGHRVGWATGGLAAAAAGSW